MQKYEHWPRTTEEVEGGSLEHRWIWMLHRWARRERGADLGVHRRIDHQSRGWTKGQHLRQIRVQLHFWWDPLLGVLASATFLRPQQGPIPGRQPHGQSDPVCEPLGEDGQLLFGGTKFHANSETTVLFADHDCERRSSCGDFCQEEHRKGRGAVLRLSV